MIAHQHDVKVIMASPTVILTSNVTLRQEWIDKTVAQIVERGAMV